ncbi:Uncharacterised protein [Klebsiella pneumoniae]|nr:Uncharacterised protein [Klebsiella pneumoniae]SVM86638.1 Uncharacterised protein [Klebsiella pneumoniae]
MAENHIATHTDQANNCQNLNKGKPEFNFTK